MSSSAVDCLPVIPYLAADSLGGDLYWSAGLSLISDIPRKPQWPVKLHGFINAGRLGCIDRCACLSFSLLLFFSPSHVILAKPLQDAIASTLAKPSISAGLGIVYRLEPVRIEMNFGVPLVASKGEGARKGFQLGVGLEFL